MLHSYHATEREAYCSGNETPIMIKFMILLFFCVGISNAVYSQNPEAFQLKLSGEMFQLPENAIKTKRQFIPHKHKELSKVFSGAMIFFYQNILSEQIQAECTFDITCSEYLKQCIARYGFIKGTLAGLNQYVDCNANNISNHAEYIINENGKVVNHIENEEY